MIKIIANSRGHSIFSKEIKIEKVKRKMIIFDYK